MGVGQSVEADVGAQSGDIANKMEMASNAALQESMNKVESIAGVKPPSGLSKAVTVGPPEKLCEGAQYNTMYSDIVEMNEGVEALYEIPSYQKFNEAGDIACEVDEIL